MPPNPKNFNVDNVRVVKIMGGNLAGSKVVRGMVFGREPSGTSSLSPGGHRFVKRAFNPVTTTQMFLV